MDKRAIMSRFWMIFLISMQFAIRLNAQSLNFSVKLTMEQPTNGYKAFLIYTGKGGQPYKKIDSATLVGQEYHFKGSVDQPQRAYLYLERGNNGFQPNAKFASMKLYLEKGNISVNSRKTLNGGTLSGTPLNEVLQGFNDISRRFDSKRDSLKKLVDRAYQVGKGNVSAYGKDFNRIDSNIKANEQDFFLRNPNSLVSLDWLKENINIPRNKSTAVKLFESLSAKVRESGAGKAYMEMLKNTQSIELGGLAPEFKVSDIDGKIISLKSYRGKYVLIDFWASWCVPCRKENPNLINAYNELKNKNFTIVSFSVDQQKKAWENAVVKDALPWTQVSDLLGMESPIAKNYGINSIPSNFLIDPNGKIIARDLRGSSLSKILSTYIN